MSQLQKKLTVLLITNVSSVLTQQLSREVVPLLQLSAGGGGAVIVAYRRCGPTYIASYIAPRLLGGLLMKFYSC